MGGGGGGVTGGGGGVSLPPRLRYPCYTLAEETLFRWGGEGAGQVKSMIVQWSI